MKDIDVPALIINGTEDSADIGKLYFQFNAVVANLKKLTKTSRKQIICNLQNQFLLKKNYFEKFVANNIFLTIIIGLVIRDIHMKGRNCNYISYYLNRTFQILLMN